MKINKKVFKIVIFSAIITLCEIMTTFFSIMYLDEFRNNLILILTISSFLLTTFLYYILIFRQSKKMGNRIPFKSTCIQFLLIIISIIFTIYNSPQPSEGNGGGAGGIIYLIGFYILAVIPIMINICSFILLCTEKAVRSLFKRKGRYNHENNNC